MLWHGLGATMGCVPASCPNGMHPKTAGRPAARHPNTQHTPRGYANPLKQKLSVWCGHWTLHPVWRGDGAFCACPRASSHPSCRQLDFKKCFIFMFVQILVYLCPPPQHKAAQVHSYGDHTWVTHPQMRSALPGSTCPQFPSLARGASARPNMAISGLTTARGHAFSHSHLWGGGRKEHMPGSCAIGPKMARTCLGLWPSQVMWSSQVTWPGQTHMHSYKPLC